MDLKKTKQDIFSASGSSKSLMSFLILKRCESDIDLHGFINKKLKMRTNQINQILLDDMDAIKEPFVDFESITSTHQPPIFESRYAADTLTKNKT